MADKKIDVNITDKEISNEVKEELKKADEIHIHKSGDDGEEVDIDINKKRKTVEVDIDKDGKKEKVKIGLSGVKVENEDGSKVNIRFAPIYILVLAVFGIFLFFIYKVIEVIFN